MFASTRAEILRMAKWPVTWVIIGVWMLLTINFGYVFDYLSYLDAVDAGNTRLADNLLSQLSLASVPTTMVAGLPMFGGALMVILSAIATGSGYGWGTWKTVFTTGPRRSVALGGTLIALAVMLLITVVLTMLTCMAASATFMTIEGESLAWPGLETLGEGFGAAFLIVLMWGAAGALIGIVAKSPAVSVGLGLVWVMVVENLVRGVAGLLGPIEAVTDVFPGTAAGSLAYAIGVPGAGQPGGAPGISDVLTASGSVTVLAIYVAAFAAITGLLVARRDVA